MAQLDMYNATIWPENIPTNTSKQGSLCGLCELCQTPMGCLGTRGSYNMEGVRDKST